MGAASRPISVALIDTHALTRECVAWALRGHSRLAVQSFATAADIPDEARVHLALLSIGAAPPNSAPVQLELAALRRRCPEMPVAILCDRCEPSAAEDAIKSGARAYIPTSQNLDVAVAALHLAHAGGTYLPPLGVSDEADPEATILETAATEVSLLEVLTRREREVLACVQRGRANKLIAYELGMSEHTVKVHVRRIMRKLQATNRTEASTIAFSKLGEIGGSDARRAR
jgi:DNA-binding NarL/FixJ family response regulator